MKMCYQETLRRDAPAAISKISNMTKATTICGVDLSPKDAFIIGTQFIQMDPRQWTQPDSFIPDRFNPDSPLYLKPGGGKRNTYAYSPFSGGQRVCLGKTFAEVTLKFTLPLYYHYFNFELVNEEHKKVRPYVTLGTRKNPEIMTRFTTRNRVPDPPATSSSQTATPPAETD